LMGFALHNLVSYSLWTPATATVFWILAGAVLSQFAPPRKTSGRLMRRGLLLASIALLVACVWFHLTPTTRRTCHWWTVQRILQEGHPYKAIDYAHGALGESNDPRDLVEILHLSRTIDYFGPDEKHTTLELATRTVELRPTDPDIQQLLAETHWVYNPNAATTPEMLIAIDRMCELDPQNPNRYFVAARLTEELGRQDLSRGYAQRGLTCQDALPTDSLYRLPPAKRLRLEMLTNAPNEP